MKLLLEHNADLLHLNHNHETVLHYAVRSKQESGAHRCQRKERTSRDTRTHISAGGRMTSGVVGTLLSSS